jgi:hypothetical protein
MLLSIAILATGFLYLMCVAWVCLYIKWTHPAVWAGKDEPSPLDYVLRYLLGLSSFIWRDHRRLGDGRLNLFVDIGRGLAVVFVVLLLARIVMG